MYCHEMLEQRIWFSQFWFHVEHSIPESLKQFQTHLLGGYCAPGILSHVVDSVSEKDELSTQI